MSNPIESIQSDLITGEIAMYLAGNGNSTSNALKGGSLDNRLPKMLYMEWYIIQNIYNLNPSDPFLRQTTNYLYSLYGIWGVLAVQRLGQVAQNPPVVSNPGSITVYVGGTATFQVTVTSSLPYTIQWYRNGVPIAGATSTTYQLTNAQLTDTGANFLAIATNTAGSTSSGNATLTVTNPIIASYWYGNTSPYAALIGGSDTLTYQGTVSVTAGQPISVPWPLAAVNNLYNVVRYPATESTKTAYYNTSTNSGSIPNAIFEAIFVLNGYKYIVTRVAVSWSATQTTVTYS